MGSRLGRTRDEWHSGQHKTSDSIWESRGKLESDPTPKRVTEEYRPFCHVVEKTKDRLGILFTPPRAKRWGRCSKSWQIDRDGREICGKTIAEECLKILMITPPSVQRKKRKRLISSRLAEHRSRAIGM